MKQQMNGRDKKSGLDLLTILRYGMVLVFVIYIAVLLGMKADSTTPFKTVSARISETAAKKSPKLKQGEDITMKKLYGLNQKDFKGADLYSSSGTMEVEEVLLVRTKNDAQMKEVQEAVEKRLSVQKNNFNGYGAEQTKLLDNAVIDVKGDYMLFAVSKYAEAYQKAFRDSL